MSCCAGEIYCNIYRDKKYCKGGSDKLNLNGICNCSHNAYKCEVEHCSFLYEIIPQRGGNHCTQMFNKCEIADKLHLKTYKEA